MPHMLLPFQGTPAGAPLPDRPGIPRYEPDLPGTQSAKLATFPGLTVAEE